LAALREASFTLREMAPHFGLTHPDRAALEFVQRFFVGLALICKRCDRYSE